MALTAHATALPALARAPPERQSAGVRGSQRAWQPSRSTRAAPVRRLAAVRPRASSTAPASSGAVADAVRTLKAAAADSSVPAKQVLAALLALEGAKETPQDWDEVLGGGGPPGKRWRLVFTSNAKQVQAAIKEPGAGGGIYFPVAACQQYDASTRNYTNSVYLGRFAALTFGGCYSLQAKILAFTFDTLTLRLGGWKTSFPLKPKVDPSAYTRSKEDPFFVMFHMDDAVICGRGRGGGVALWARTTPQWELEAGVV